MHARCEMIQMRVFWLLLLLFVCYGFVLLCRGRVGAIGVAFDLVEQA